MVKGLVSALVLGGLLAVVPVNAWAEDAPPKKDKPGTGGTWLGNGPDLGAIAYIAPR